MAAQLRAGPVSAISAVPRSGSRFRATAGLDRGKITLGGGEKVFALAGALGGEIGVAADRQALAGEVGRCDGGHIALIEQRELQHAAFHQLIAGARSEEIQSRPADLMSSVMRAWVTMPRSPTRTTGSRLKRCLSLSICVASVIGSAVLPPAFAGAGSRTLDGNGTAVGSAQQAVDNLQCPSCRRDYSPRLASGQQRPSM